MKNFNSGNRSGGRRDYNRKGFGGRDSRRPSMHDAVCDECGKNCQVPFRPSGEKPIYCSECFENKGGRDNKYSGRRDYNRKGFGGRDSRRPSRGNNNDRSFSQLTEKIDTLNNKLDSIISLLSGKDKKPKLAVKKTKKSKKPKGEKKASEIDKVSTIVGKKDSNK